MSAIYGYARVSSNDQNEARQLLALCNAGVPEANLFVDRRSGKDFNRPEWIRLKRRLRKNDLLVISSLDRLGRSHHHMLEEWRYLVKRRKVEIQVLDMPLLNTANKSSGLIDTVIAEIVLQLLSFAAENERRNIRERQRQGIEAARARGISFGRPRRQLPVEFTHYARQYVLGKIGLSATAKACDIPVSTFRDHMRRIQSSGNPGSLT